MGFFYAFAQKQDIAYVIAIYTPSINYNADTIIFFKKTTELGCYRYQFSAIRRQGF
jgi:hypothetical protein